MESLAFPEKVRPFLVHRTIAGRADHVLHAPSKGKSAQTHLSLTNTGAGTFITSQRDRKTEA